MDALSRSSSTARQTVSRKLHAFGRKQGSVVALRDDAAAPGGEAVAEPSTPGSSSHANATAAPNTAQASAMQCARHPSEVGLPPPPLHGAAPFYGRMCRMQNVCVEKGAWTWFTSDLNPAHGMFYSINGVAAEMPNSISLRPMWIDGFGIPTCDENIHPCATFKRAPSADLPKSDSSVWYGDEGAITVVVGSFWAENFGHALGDDIFPVYQALTRLGVQQNRSATRLVLTHSCDYRFGHNSVGKRACGFLNELSRAVTAHKVDYLDRISERRVCFRDIILGTQAHQLSTMHAGEETAMEPWGRFMCVLMAQYGVDCAVRPKKHHIMLIKKNGRRSLRNDYTQLAKDIRARFGVGVSVMDPSKLTLEQQVRAMSQSTVALTPCGGISFATVFLPNDAVRIISDFWDVGAGAPAYMEDFLWRFEHRTQTVHYPLTKDMIEIPPDAKEKTEWLQYRNEGRALLDTECLYAMLQRAMHDVSKKFAWHTKLESSLSGRSPCTELAKTKDFAVCASYHAAERCNEEECGVPGWWGDVTAVRGWRAEHSTIDKCEEACNAESTCLACVHAGNDPNRYWWPVNFRASGAAVAVGKSPTPQIQVCDKPAPVKESNAPLTSPLMNAVERLRRLFQPRMSGKLSSEGKSQPKPLVHIRLPPLEMRRAAPRLNLLLVHAAPAPDGSWETAFGSAWHLLRDNMPGNITSFATLPLVEGVVPKDYDPLRLADVVYVKSNFGWFVDTYFRKYVSNMPNGMRRPKIVLLVSGVVPPSKPEFYDAFVYEVSFYERFIKHLPQPRLHGFGIDTRFMRRPTAVERKKHKKKFDFVWVGQLGDYKRARWVLSETPRDAKTLVICTSVNDKQLYRALEKSPKVALLRAQTYDGLRARLWESKAAFITMPTGGGGERLVLEARACGLPLYVAKDNTKLLDLATGPLYDIYYYALRILQAADLVLVDRPVFRSLSYEQVQFLDKSPLLKFEQHPRRAAHLNRA
jgi:hypothetical protein